MSVDLTLIFLNSQTIRELNGLEHLIEELKATGFSLSKFKVSNDDFQIFVESDIYNAQVLEAAYEKCLLNFSMRIPTIIQENLFFEFFVQIGWGEKHLEDKDRTWVGMTIRNSGLLRWPKYNPNYHAQFLLDVGKKLYSILLPEFAWIDYGNFEPITWFDDLEQSKIKQIQWANFYGPNYPSGDGRDKILNAPAWKLEHLENNGILFVLAPSPNSNAEDFVDTTSLREYFSIQ